jgi:hypothetical protein
MKTRFLATLLSATLASWAVAADTLPGTEDSLESGAPQQGQLEILLAPIALYPDALVALILPAATHPSEIVLASRFLSSGGNEEDIESQVWDDSVKALARFPEVVEFMDENLGWTQDVGDAFVAHPAEVMGAIQALRARGTRNGTLASTPQQQVVFEDDNTIRIIPAEPEVIYVPYYEPSILYPSYSYTYFPSSLVWFGVGYGIGSWLSYDCDWRYRTIWVNHHRSHWTRDYDWRRRYKRDVDFCIGGTNWNRWTPSTSYRRTRPRGDFNYSRTTVRTTRGRFDGGSGRFDSNTTWTESDRNRFERRNETTTRSNTDSRSVRRPDSLRTPTRIERTDSNRTVDSRRDNTAGDRTGRFDRNADGRRDGRASHKLTRYDGRTPTETVSSPRRGTTAPAVERRNNAPIRRAPDISQRRTDAVDRRPEVSRSSPTRRESPRPSISAPAAPAVSRPAPAPARRITSGADIRRPQPSVAPPVRQRSAPAAAPSRQPSYSAPRNDTRRSSPPRDAGSSRHHQVQPEEH